MSYRAVWDSRVWAWTLATVALLAVVLVGLLRRTLFATPARFGLAGLAAVLIIAVTVAALAFAPRRYAIDGKKLHVHTLLARFTYDLSNVSEVKRLAAPEVFSPGTLRTFGAGGPFGYYGYFKSQKLGKFLAFVTDLDRLIVLRCHQQTLVISPHDPEGFLREVQQSIAGRQAQ